MMTDNANGVNGIACLGQDKFERGMGSDQRRSFKTLALTLNKIRLGTIPSSWT